METLSMVECAFRAVRALEASRIEVDEDHYVVVEGPYQWGAGEEYASGDVRIVLPMLDFGDGNQYGFDDGDVWLHIRLAENQIGASFDPTWLVYATRGTETITPNPEEPYTTDLLAHAIEWIEFELGLAVPAMPG